MNKIWHDEAWEDYLYWQTQDKKTLKRINQLLKDIDRNGYDGIGKPEPLRTIKLSSCNVELITRINNMDIKTREATLFFIVHARIEYHKRGYVSKGPLIRLERGGFNNCGFIKR
ncbi:Txe/YoeB family addiction module toxin, partial [Desulfosporosinus sp. OT]|uniref:Txe/YoeB family addiction module toxin n=1 Tax=Desulfosporosinus sp. OT TaxID=913865 RepID=UPI000223B02C